MTDADALRTVTLDEAALFALARIAEHRRRTVGSDREAMARREECRSYAVDVVNAILRADPSLAEGLGEVRQ